ncbi:hypothetical protein ACFV3E_32295 [Streptomyces sp. NPDC059718]
MALSGTTLIPATAAPTGAKPATAPLPARETDPSLTFSFTGAPQSLTVPANAVVTITADGAGGADNSGTPCSVTGTGGSGARVITTLSQTSAPTTFTINVGGTGGKGCNGTGTGGAGGFNGGAPGGGLPISGFRSEGPGGGGASSVSTGGSLLVVAGGGAAAGGTGAGSTGGNGGNGINGTTADATAGTAGSATGPGASPGRGGGGGSTSTSTGGAMGAAGTVPQCSVTNGGPGGGFSGAQVGTGGTGGSVDGGCTSTAGAGGGGGGGYFAGGGGGSGAVNFQGTSAGGGGGGGGSSFATPTGTGTSYALSTVGTANNNGQVVISYIVLTPTLAITKTHTGNFTQGRPGTYTITVGNTGSGPTDGSAVIVHDTLPPGLTARSITGTGWNCILTALTCTRNDALAAGGSYPPITLEVDVSCGCDTGHQITNTSTVTGGGDTTTHSATDPTTIKRNKLCHHDGQHPK